MVLPFKAADEPVKPDKVNYLRQMPRIDHHKLNLEKLDSYLLVSCLEVKNFLFGPQTASSGWSLLKLQIIVSLLKCDEFPSISKPGFVQKNYRLRKSSQWRLNTTFASEIILLSDQWSNLTFQKLKHWTSTLNSYRHSLVIFVFIDLTLTSPLYCIFFMSSPNPMKRRTKQNMYSSAVQMDLRLRSTECQKSEII